jgi:hypothetical protein
MAESEVKMLKADQVSAEKESTTLLTKVKELEGQSSAELLEKAEAQNEVNELRSQLHNQKVARAEERKKSEEIKQSAKKHFFDRAYATYDEALGEDTSSLTRGAGAVPSPASDITTSDRRGNDLENVLSVSNGGLPTGPTPPSSPGVNSSKKRPLESPMAGSPSKRSRNGEEGRE